MGLRKKLLSRKYGYGVRTQISRWLNRVGRPALRNTEKSTTKRWAKEVGKREQKTELSNYQKIKKHL